MEGLWYGLLEVDECRPGVEMIGLRPYDEKSLRDMICRKSIESIEPSIN